MSCTLVFLSLSGMAPAYLASDCQPVSDDGRRQLPTQGHVSSGGPTAAMQTDVLLLHVQHCGTVFQLIRDKLTLTLNSLSGC